MSYRIFTDAGGLRWEVWLVLPSAAERRTVERRVLGDRRKEPRPHSPDRRIPQERRLVDKPRYPVADRFREGWLCFETDGEKRRLAPIPPDWATADLEQLLVLCQAAKRVLKCGPE